MRRYILSYAAIGMETDIRNDLYAHLQRLPVSFHDGGPVGSAAVSRAMGDISIIRRFIGFGLVFLVVNGITLLMVLALLARLHMGLAILVGAASVPLIWLGRMFAHDYHEVARQLQDQDGDLTTIIEEGATGIRIIKAFGRQRLMAERFHGAAQPLWETSMEKVRLRGRFFAVLGIIPNLTLAMVVCGGAYAVGNGSLTIGGLVEFVQLVLTLVWPVESLGEILSMRRGGGDGVRAHPRGARHRANRCRPRWRPRHRHRPGTRAFRGRRIPLRDRTRRRGHAPRTGNDIVLDGVEPRHRAGRDDGARRHDRFGQDHAWPSLVPRLYDVTSGSVTLDGVDVRDFKLTSLRRHVGVAFEDPTLFSASVRENLLLGYPDATDDDIERALDTAQARFAYDLPWGLDTRVGEQGLSLSGGQRQRLALARAIIGQPRVLDARRPALRPRRAHRGVGRERARAGARRRDRAAGRAPAVDAGPRRPRRAARERTHHRRRHPLGADGQPRVVPGDPLAGRRRRVRGERRRGGAR